MLGNLSGKNIFVDSSSSIVDQGIETVQGKVDQLLQGMYFSNVEVKTY